MKKKKRKRWLSKRLPRLTYARQRIWHSSMDSRHACHWPARIAILVEAFYWSLMIICLMIRLCFEDFICVSIFVNMIVVLVDWTTESIFLHDQKLSLRLGQSVLRHGHVLLERRLHSLVKWGWSLSIESLRRRITCASIFKTCTNSRKNTSSQIIMCLTDPASNRQSSSGVLRLIFEFYAMAKS